MDGLVVDTAHRTASIHWSLSRKDMHAKLLGWFNRSGSPCESCKAFLCGRYDLRTIFETRRRNFMCQLHDSSN